MTLPSGPDVAVRVPQTGEDTTEDDDRQPSQEYLDGILEDLMNHRDQAGS